MFSVCVELSILISLEVSCQSWMQCNCCACGVWQLLESKHFKPKICLCRKFVAQLSQCFSTFQISNQWKLGIEIKYGPKSQIKKIWCLQWNFNDMEAHKFKNFTNLQWILLGSPIVRTLRPICFHKYIETLSPETVLVVRISTIISKPINHITAYAMAYCISEILNSPWSTVPSFL